MASSMKLEYPLIDVLPNIEHARDRLLARIFHYRKDPEASRLTTDEDYALLYAYSKLSLVPFPPLGNAWTFYGAAYCKVT
jgi:hypothetical protein